MANYPNLNRAALAMALDIGVAPTIDVAATLASAGYAAATLAAIDAALGQLSNAKLARLCCGDDGARDRIAATLPDATDAVLNELFDAVGA